MSKINYLVTCIKNSCDPTRFSCPSCGSKNNNTIARKYFFSVLRRCEDCNLQFRAPTTNAVENEKFYQESYRQGFTSDTPDDEELKTLLDSKFANHEKNYSGYIAVLKTIGVQPGARILDFGCSWGYGSWQLESAGYKVTAFEISKPRCRYAKEKLGIDAHDDIGKIHDQKFDVFFSSHVLEHVPSVGEILKLAKKLLVKQGYFVAFMPNGAHDHKVKNPKAWSQLWGMVHPNLLDDVYFKRNLGDCIFAAPPYDLSAIKKLNDSKKGGTIGQLDSGELMVIKAIN